VEIAKDNIRKNMIVFQRYNKLQRGIEKAKAELLIVLVLFILSN